MFTQEELEKMYEKGYEMGKALAEKDKRIKEFEDWQARAVVAINALTEGMKPNTVIHCESGRIDINKLIAEAEKGE